jgi:hypothetical protein
MKIYAVKIIDEQIYKNAFDDSAMKFFPPFYHVDSRNWKEIIFSPPSFFLQKLTSSGNKLFPRW